MRSFFVFYERVDILFLEKDSFIWNDYVIISDENGDKNTNLNY